MAPEVQVEASHIAHNQSSLFIQVAVQALLWKSAGFDTVFITFNYGNLSSTKIHRKILYSILGKLKVKGINTAAIRITILCVIRRILRAVFIVAVLCIYKCISKLFDDSFCKLFRSSKLTHNLFIIICFIKIIRIILNSLCLFVS